MDRQSKRDQIEAIDDEVNALHPLLHEILGKLKNVLYVEYTHGPHEMGADFVLERTDPDINETFYIGVIAKTDKVLQNFADLERQIKECKVKRYIRQGKQQVRLQEIWAITSKTFSAKAKEKINDEFPDRRIHFFDSDWLVTRVDEHYPYYWHQLPNATGTYLAATLATMAQLNSQTTLLASSGLSTAVHIDLDVKLIDEDRYKRQKPRSNKNYSVNFKEEVLLNKFTLLQAEMGFGKSTLVRDLISELAAPETVKKTNLLPIYQPFSVFLQSPAKVIESRIQELLGDACYAEAKANNSEFLLVLDGIDEVNGTSEEARRVLDSLIAEVKQIPSIKMVLTSRPFKLLEESPDLLKSAKRYEIRPLTVQKFIKYIKDVCKSLELPKKLYDDLAKSELFRQLPQNPIAAALLSNLLSQKKQELPSNLTELYSKSVEYMLGRWDQSRGLSTEKLYKACERIARHLARYMVENQLVYVSSTEAKQMIESFFGEREMGVSPTDVYSYLTERSRVFGFIPNTDAIFFRHRSFAEYLYALDAFQRRDFKVDDRAYHPYWTNIFFFYIGLLAECPDLLRELVALKPETDRARWIRFFQTPNYFLAGYQSPYNVVEDGLVTLFSDIAQLYLDVRSGKTTSNLANYSEMRLLWLFAMVSKYNFGYEFFKKALPLTMLQLDESKSLSEEAKAYGMYFAATALGELNDKGGFVFLLGRHKTEALPLPISLGLTCETDFAGKNFANDPVIKQHHKKLRKLLIPDEAETHAAQKRLERLFTEPLQTQITARKAHGKNARA